ncbi:hypothetical protein ACX93W_17165 [Paenibacillus sp. CAU 1782]
MRIQTLLTRTTQSQRWIVRAGMTGLLSCSLMLGGCGILDGTAQKEVTFELSSDVRSELTLMEEPEIFGKLLNVSQPVDYSDILFMTGGKVFFNWKDGFYQSSLDGTIDQNEPLQLLDTTVLSVSENGKLALYERDSEVWLMDIASGESTLLLDKSDRYYQKRGFFDYTSEVQFGDPEGNYVIFQPQVGHVLIWDVTAEKWIEIDLEQRLKVESYGYSNDLSIVDHHVYIQVESSDIQSGTYKMNLNEPQSSELVKSALVQEEEHSSYWLKVLSNGDLLLAGESGDNTGVYLFDSATKETQTILEKQYEETRRGYAFSLSPDETKLLIHEMEPEQISLYQLNNGEVTAVAPVMKGQQLYSIVGLLVDWSEDSENFYMKLAFDNGLGDGSVVEQIGEFSVQDLLKKD